jgi:hypothetical protein
VLEATAHGDLSNWIVPERSVPDERKELSAAVARMLGLGNDGCYCSFSDEKILEDIYAEQVPDAALILSCCWETICRVRGPEINSVPAEIWVELCRRWASIKARENPRDF